MLGFIHEPEGGHVRAAARSCWSRPIAGPGFHAGRPPHNNGLRYPADPPKVEEIIAVMRAAGDRVHGRRLCGLIVILWRASKKRSRSPRAIWITAALRGLSVVERADAAARSAWTRGAGKNCNRGSRSESSCPSVRFSASSTSHGRPTVVSAPAGNDLRQTAAAAGVRRRFAPHQLRHAHAVEMAREGVPLIVIQRQLGHSNLGITSVYLQGIDNAEIIETVHARRAPMIPVSASRRL
jgi:Phage integrase family